MDTTSGTQQRSLVPYLMSVCAAGIHSLYFLPRTVDDLFIFLRYAENLSLGHGLVYNVGEAVEGFSSPVWTFLLALCHSVGLGGVSISKVLGLVSLTAIVCASVHIVYVRFKASSIVALAAGCLVAANSYIVSWSVLGLETPFHLACLIWGLNGLLIADPKRIDTVRTGIVLGLLALSRPEGALDVAGLTMGAAAYRILKGDFRLAWRCSMVPAFIAAAMWGGYELFRLAYYGLPFPHTYYAKPGRGFDINRWAPLVRNGASLPEIWLLIGGASALLIAPRWASLPVFGLVSARLYFVGAVEVDWMPNIRHFQPVYVSLSLLLFSTFVRLTTFDHPRAKWAAYSGGACTIAALLYAWLPIDSRFGPWDYKTHGGGKSWVRVKTKSAWLDTWDALRRVPPQHAKTRGPGMLQQAYNVMGASDKPMATEWYIGRDIGRVGWLTPVRIMDTAGLFTPIVVRSQHWQKTMKADQDMVNTAFQKRVIATELLDGWAHEARRSPHVRALYRPIYRGNWLYLSPKNVRKPTDDERLNRFEYALSRLPTSYYAMTLYGEAVGAILERDVKRLRKQVNRSKR